ncbi:MAG: hypothetical protein GKR93_17095 [Gammaproteobacteria bacterium]|nr:hypothetical protein [Gammaproteobacteria bacterium]
MRSLIRRVFYLLIWLSPAQAFESIDLQLDSLQRGAVSIEGLHFNFSPVNADKPGLFVQLQRIESSFLKGSVSAELSCPDAVYLSNLLTCKDGSIILRTAGREMLQVKMNANFHIPDMHGQASFTLESSWGNLQAELNINNEQLWDFRFESASLELSILSNLSIPGMEFFQSHKITNGTLDMQASVKGSGSQTREISVRASAKELSLEGESILEKVNLLLESDLQWQDARWEFTQRIEANSGEMYLQPGFSLLDEKPGFYLDASSSILSAVLQGNWIAAEKLFQLKTLHFSHPGIIDLQGQASMFIGETDSLRTLSLKAKIKDLAATYPVYLQPILLQSNFSDLEIAGGIELGLAYRNGALDNMELSLQEVFLEDDASRFSISDLNSNLLLGNDENSVQSTLSWQGLSFYRLDLGQGSILFESTNKDIRVLEWQDVSILDGALVIDEFDLKNIASSNFSMRLGGRLQPISMDALTQALGWTVFPGALSGEISGLKYSDNKLQLEGDILISIFGGSLTIQNLQVDDLFSPYSTVATGIKIKALDLEQMTDVFSFGKIEGSLSGHVDKLRLEDWQPSYFEAEFATPLDDEAPHRISQKALENLNELGGGLSGTLSRGFLRFLPAYSYGRLGFSCRLLNRVCELGGVEDSGDSFSILTKGGLFPPWVEVKGAGRSIKWDDLIDGLKQISKGEVAIE